MWNGTGKFPTPDSHVDGENSAKTMVYNMKRNSKRRRGEKTEERKKGRRNTTVKRKNSKLLITLLRHDRGCFFALLHVQFLPLNTDNRYLFSRFRLAFSPTFYKFIVRACYAWVHSCFGVRAKTSPYNGYNKKRQTIRERSIRVYNNNIFYLLIFLFNQTN